MAKSYKREDKAFAAHIAQEADELAAAKQRLKERAREKRHMRAAYKVTVRAVSTVTLINRLLGIIYELALEPLNTQKEKRLTFEYDTIRRELERRLRAAGVIKKTEDIGLSLGRFNTPHFYPS